MSFLAPRPVVHDRPALGKNEAPAWRLRTGTPRQRAPRRGRAGLAAPGSGGREFSSFPWCRVAHAVRPIAVVGLLVPKSRESRLCSVPSERRFLEFPAHRVRMGLEAMSHISTGRVLPTVNRPVLTILRFGAALALFSAAAITPALSSRAAPEVNGNPRGQSEPPFSKSVVTTHGIRLSLSAPGRIEPKNGLIEVKVEAKNVGTHPVMLDDWQPFGCGTATPVAELVNANGKLVDWLPPGRSMPSCPVSISSVELSCSSTPPFIRRLLLYPGKSVSARSNLVLATSHIEALIQQTTRYAPCKRPNRFHPISRAYNIAARVNFSLYPASLLSAVLSGSPPSRIVVERPSGAKGNVWSDGWVSCQGTKQVAWSAENGVPETTKGNVVQMDTSGCDLKNMVVEMALGWVGYPVAFVSYKRGQPL